MDDSWSADDTSLSLHAAAPVASDSSHKVSTSRAGASTVGPAAKVLAGSRWNSSDDKILLMAVVNTGVNSWLSIIDNFFGHKATSVGELKWRIAKLVAYHNLLMAVRNKKKKQLTMPLCDDYISPTDVSLLDLSPTAKLLLESYDQDTVRKRSLLTSCAKK